MARALQGLGPHASAIISDALDHPLLRGERDGAVVGTQQIMHGDGVPGAEAAGRVVQREHGHGAQAGLGPAARVGRDVVEEQVRRRRVVHVRAGRARSSLVLRNRHAARQHEGADGRDGQHGRRVPCRGAGAGAEALDGARGRHAAVAVWHEDHVVAGRVELVQDRRPHHRDVFTVVREGFLRRFGHRRQSWPHHAVAVRFEGFGERVEVQRLVPGAVHDYDGWF